MIGALDRHSQKPSWLVENHHSIVLIKHGEFPGKTRPAPVFAGRRSIRLSSTAASLARKFLHDRKILNASRDNRTAIRPVRYPSVPPQKNVP
jgi:hypothetical protein